MALGNFILRMVTILIGCTFGITCVVYSNITLFAFFFAITTGCFIEFSKLTFSANKVSIIASFLFIMSLSMQICANQLGFHIEDYITFPLIRYTPFLFLLAMVGRDILLTSVFMIWIAPSMIICVMYGVRSSSLLITIMTVTWLSDGGAYMFGKMIGSRRMCTSISPNKTLEGLVGGLLFSLFTTYFIFIHVSGQDAVMNGLDTDVLLILALLTGIVGQIGDLLESLFKRIVGVKDSGVIILGHGGFLDRFDSIFTAIPVSYVFLHQVGAF
jgi:phosphatidate cytidylyltransferase